MGRWVILGGVDLFTGASPEIACDSPSNKEGLLIASTSISSIDSPSVISTISRKTLVIKEHRLQNSCAFADSTRLCSLDKCRGRFKAFEGPLRGVDQKPGGAGVLLWQQSGFEFKDPSQAVV